MRARLGLWWQKIQQYPVRSLVIIGAGLLGIVVLVALIGGYFFNWGWTGFGSYTPPAKESNFQRAKTLWDWLQLLIVPIVLAVGVFWLNQIQKDREQKAAEERAQTEREITADNQREAALKAYIDNMSELLADFHTHPAAQTVARVRTLTTLSRLDEGRKRTVLQFLYEAGLINKQSCLVNLSGADLSGVSYGFATLQQTDLSGAYFTKAILPATNMSGADLRKTVFSEANLSQVDFSGADLSGAIFLQATLSFTNFKDANLTHTNFIAANLTSAKFSGLDLTRTYFTDAVLTAAKFDGAHITQEELDRAKSLKDATMPDGSKHP